MKLASGSNGDEEVTIVGLERSIIKSIEVKE